MADSFNAELVRRWAAMSVQLLKLHRAELNALNVFPVPDGDTGTNLYLTFQAAATSELQRTGKADDVQDALAALARGALLGARGNSGVMLASVLQAISVAAIGNDRLLLADMLVAGAKAARTSVLKPVEGTALTVLDAAATSGAFRPDAIAQAARVSLATTPDLLPALKAAGVVDAGGRGVVLLLDAMAAAWAGHELNSPAVGFVPDEVPVAQGCSADARFELMFLTPTTDIDSVSDIVEVDGKSVVITRGPTESQVHVHLDEPQELLKVLGESFQVTEVQIELLDSQKQQRKVVAQAFGHSLVQFLAEQAVQVVAAEPNHRPSVQDFVAAGLKANAPEILLLPSDADSIVVANLAAAELKQLDIAAFVIPTQSLPQTLAALSVFDSNSALPELISEMTNAAASVTTIAVTQAVRDANTSVGSVKQSDWLWLVDNQILNSSEDFDSGLSQLESHFENTELITVLAGEATSVADTESLFTWLQKTNPAAEIQQIPGNQKIWHFIIGVE